MSKISQRQSVFLAVSYVLGKSDFTGAPADPTKEQRREIYELVTNDLADGHAEFSEEARTKYHTRELIRTKYVPGLVNNWLRKDVNLNGGEKYEPKNPGSRAGQGDAVLKNLKNLLAQLTDAVEIASVEQAIKEREAEVAAAKNKPKEIDASKIPESLRHLIPS